MQHASNKDLIDQFCEDIDKIINILASHNNIPQKIDDKFSVLLRGCFIGFYEELLSAKTLAKCDYSFSLLIIARSLYELAVQLAWIKMLEPNKQQEAIEAFLNFDGTARNHKGKLIHEWHKTSIREMTKLVGLNKKIFSADMRDLLPPEKDDDEAIAIYDYLSKAAHWSPIFLKNSIGYKDGSLQVKDGSNMVAVFIGTLAVKAAALLFTGYWLEHFFPEDSEAREALDTIIKIKFLDPATV